MTHDLGIVGTIGRFKPVHIGHVAVLETLCERAEKVIIGLGSCNEHNARNPFTPQESREMIDLVLRDRFSNYSFIEIPDLHNGPRWRELVLPLYGTLDHFVTANAYVASLLEKDYHLLHPVTLIPEQKKIPINATMVREAMAKGLLWEHLCPDVVVQYLKEKKLDERFVAEFGLETLSAALDRILEEDEVMV